MKYRLLRWLACPSCSHPDLRVVVTQARDVRVQRGAFTPDEKNLPGVDLARGIETEIIEGSLTCASCRATFPIVEGIPHLLREGADPGPTTAHRWTTFDSAAAEWQDSFLDYAAPLGPEDFLGRLVLDAGCGYGRHAFFAARFGAEVVALDSSLDAIRSCRANTDGCDRVHPVLGDIHSPPLRDGLFSLTYCFGVLHHLEQPWDAVRRLGALLAPGGRLSLWVYGPRQGLTLQVNNALRGVTTNLDAEELYRTSRWIARGLRVFSHTPYRWFGQVPVARSLVSHLPVHDHARWPFDVVVADVYDRLRIPVRHWFTREQLEAWLADAGYLDVRVSRRVSNNETFRATALRR